MKIIAIVLLATSLYAGNVAPRTEARTVKYGDHDVAELHCAVNYTTSIIFSHEEKLAHVLIGEPDNWVVDGVGVNGSYIRPTPKANNTNLIVIGSSGQHYTFVVRLTETPDLMVYVDPSEAGSVKKVRLYTQSDVGVYEKRLAEMSSVIEKLQGSMAGVQQAADRKVAIAKAEMPQNIKSPYRFEQDKAPFNLRAMYHDGKFTYIELQPSEVPSIYEEVDGKPKLVQASYKNGLYTVDKVLTTGYFAIGKAKSKFYSR